MKNLKYIYILIFIISVFMRTEVNAYGVYKQAIIGDSLQTKEYLLQIGKRKIDKSDYKLTEEEFIDRYAYSKRTERLIHYYFKKREKIEFKTSNMDNFYLDDFLFSLFNFNNCTGGYDALFAVFLILLLASILFAALAVLLLIYGSIALINGVKLITYSRRKLLLHLIDRANYDS